MRLVGEVSAVEPAFCALHIVANLPEPALSLRFRDRAGVGSRDR